MTEQLERDIIQHGPYMIDANTGEVLGLAPEKAQFHVHDRASAEWVLERLSEAEAEVAALERRKTVLVANIESMQLEAERRVTFLMGRFLLELQAFAEKELAGKKTRTWKSPFGRLSFRKGKSRLVVHDEAKAVEWAKQNQPQAVKVTEKLLVSMLDNVYDDFEAPGLSIEPARESFAIKTGVEE